MRHMVAMTDLPASLGLAPDRFHTPMRYRPIPLSDWQPMATSPGAGRSQRFLSGPGQYIGGLCPCRETLAFNSRHLRHHLSRGGLLSQRLRACPASTQRSQNSGSLCHRASISSAFQRASSTRISQINRMRPFTRSPTPAQSPDRRQCTSCKVALPPPIRSSS